jgi:hypothetical protein
MTANSAKSCDFHCIRFLPFRRSGVHVDYQGFLAGEIGEQFTLKQHRLRAFGAYQDQIRAAFTHLGVEPAPMALAATQNGGRWGGCSHWVTSLE